MDGVCKSRDCQRGHKKGGIADGEEENSYEEHLENTLQEVYKMIRNN